MKIIQSWEMWRRLSFGDGARGIRNYCVEIIAFKINEFCVQDFRTLSLLY